MKQSAYIFKVIFHGHNPLCFVERVALTFSMGQIYGYIDNQALTCRAEDRIAFHNTLSQNER